jgi:ABC-type branched-subunit amino acid transport system substrate-binding protein
MNSPRIALTACTVAIAAIAALTGTAGAAPAPRAAACGGTIAVATVAKSGLDGAANQAKWASLAVANENAQYGTTFKVVVKNGFNTAASAKSIAKSIAADSSIIGMVGYQTSTATAAGGPLLSKAGLAYVTASATRTSLADGSLPGFYRVVASDALQGPAIARYVQKDLKGANVVIVQQSDTYSVDLAASVAKSLTNRGVANTRISVGTGTDNYAADVAKIGADVDVVVLPFVNAPQAEVFAAALTAAGRTPKLVGGDALFGSSFDVPGATVATFLGDMTRNAYGRKVAATYEAKYGTLDQSGAGAYTAARAVMAAGRAACNDDGTATREGVASAMPRVELATSIFGTPIAFQRNGNVKGGVIHFWRVLPNGTFDFVC